MSDKLQEMLQRIYEEGVNKAKEEAQGILLQAKQQAQDLKAESEKEAKKLISQAEDNAKDIESRMQSDLRMAAEHAMHALKNKIIDVVMVESIDKHVTESTNDPVFMQKVILELISKWTPETALVLTFPESRKSDFESFFSTTVKKAFAGNLRIDYSPLMKNGIVIAPADSTYKLSFKDEDFANFFKSFLRPRARHILFGE
jgi:V/A-type H+-transporting ATPase subunit E